MSIDGRETSILCSKYILIKFISNVRLASSSSDRDAVNMGALNTDSCNMEALNTDTLNTHALYTGALNTNALT